MGKLAGFVGTTVGSTVGWYAGATVGMMTAFMVSCVGAGVGLYVARRVARDYLVVAVACALAIGVPARGQTLAPTTGATAGATAGATPGSVKAAGELLVVMHADKALHDAMSAALDAQVEHNPALEPMKATMHEFADKYMTWEVVRPKLTAIYAESFSEKELRDMIAFYRTPTGQKVAEMQGVLSAKGQAMGLDILQAHQADLAAMLQQRAQQPSAAPSPAAPAKPDSARTP